jgi:hypothetical protein
LSALKAVTHSGHEHEFEPQLGLPEQLPSGERLLWQGAPDWKRLARERFHLPALAGYFVAILVLRAMYVMSGEGSAADVVMAVVMLLPLVVFALASLAALAWLSARTTVYTITDKRVVMRIGIVLSLTFNLPLRQIESAGLKLHPGGHGNIPLTLSGKDRIAILHLWPHARPWRVTRPEPMLCCVPDAAHVAKVLHAAWTEALGSDAATADLAETSVSTGEAARIPRVRENRGAPQFAID